MDYSDTLTSRFRERSYRSHKYHKFVRHSERASERASKLKKGRKKSKTRPTRSLTMAERIVHYGVPLTPQRRQSGVFHREPKDTSYDAVHRTKVSFYTFFFLFDRSRCYCNIARRCRCRCCCDTTSQMAHDTLAR